MAEGFGARLRSEMEKKGWNATMLAAKSGLDGGAVSRHLDREKAPRADSIDKYCAALGVSAEWLAYGRKPAALEPTVVVLIGSDALERVLAHYPWPDVDISIVDKVCADARKEASLDGKDRPESAWHLRVGQLLRDYTKPDKSVPQRAPAKPVDLTEESPEVQAVRKRPRRL